MFESRFQSFADVGGPARAAERAAELRGELKKLGLAGFVVPRADEHQNEYVPPGDERLLWLTGFSGSAGIAIVLRDKAALFVDGRYAEQAKAQTDPQIFELRHVVNDPPAEWIGRSLEPGEKLGYDPRLHTRDDALKLAAACENAGAELVAVDPNPIDVIWRDRPAPPVGPVSQHKARFAGESASAKIGRTREALQGADGLVVSDPHNLAWLFNIRGADVPHTPLPLGFAYVPSDGRPTIFLSSRKLSQPVREALSLQAELLEPEAFVPFVERLGERRSHVAFDSATAPVLLTQTLEKAGGKAEVRA
ncbi:MAG: aminopeptidase P family N-terminal domain-containing protein, partial [Hyphomicrobiales bacterium]|nr:aminopeptidase P family N-terminal domain-containing protein [Hyphomicrobiales bacterium]